MNNIRNSVLYRLCVCNCVKYILCIMYVYVLFCFFIFLFFHLFFYLIIEVMVRDSRGIWGDEEGLVFQVFF